MTNQRISVTSWETWKGLIYELYLRQGWTLEQVTLEIYRRYGVLPSKRQCKQRLKSWGYDSKRIPKRIWVAFNVVDCHYEHRCKFQIYVRDGHQTRTITPEAIKKQIARYKNDPPESLRASLTEAQRHLHDYGVRIFAANDDSSSLQLPPEEENNVMLGEEGNDNDGSDSTASIPDLLSTETSLDPMPAIAWFSSSLHAFEDYETNDCFKSLPIRRTSLDDDATTSDLSNNWSQPMQSLDANAIELDKFGIEESMEILDISTELAALALQKTTRKDDQMQLHLSLPTGLRAVADRGTKHDVLQFALCYDPLNVSAPGKLRDLDHLEKDRQLARTLLHKMLSQHNVNLPGALSYLTTILHSSANFKVYFAFLSDCWNVISMSPDLPKSELATYVIFLCKSAGDDRELAKAVPTSREMLQQWRLLTLTSTDFRINLERLVQLYGRESSPLIIMRYQYAWSLLQDGHNHMALDMLIQTLSLSRLVLGYNHLITSNGLAITARAFEKCSCYEKAVEMYAECIQHLNGAPVPLMPFKTKMQARLARAYALQGCLKEAEIFYLQALKWRRENFGMLHDRTWDVVNELTEAYQRMSGDQCANAFYAEHVQLYNKAYETWRNQQLANDSDVVEAAK